MTTDTDQPQGRAAGDEGAGEPALTVDELAARAGLTVRTVRFYGTRGLLPPPVIGPRRVGRYGREHLARLELIEELQQQGMTLAAIERYLERLPPDVSARDLAVHRAVVSTWAPDAVETVGREELVRRAGRALDDDDIERLAAMGVIRSGDGDAHRVDLALFRLGVRLLDMPLSQESIVAAREVLLGHSRQAARELSELLRGETAQRDARDVRSLSADMQPLVVQALLTAFQRSLKEELGVWLDRASADGAAGTGTAGATGTAGTTGAAQG
ncbi:MerR family transcriptional regulator [Streptomyces griseoviridis]|jgi:DNA-binding transcriptional MerR regulator|uniref:DNA-binding transcriptional MerR regulator n=2 Tax=Streptomyces griseoviridis TaxID=45398 RepID=A0ABT9LPG4_STRGD|nr:MULTISPECIES: MerR family transcriptional regulator [Streptomyces]MDP9685436.1 DNA-binding transcriptional MerR regulator [Streptomyces griseoviridis]GGS32977.1 transcriptional regulator [Streptomyces niveoruber]GGS87402.1 transcriptional regulator [Streptomyces griseoviridis]